MISALVFLGTTDKPAVTPQISSPCSSKQFSCFSGECVHLDRQCDLQKDCVDGSDEKDCGKICVSSSNMCMRERTRPYHLLLTQWTASCPPGQRGVLVVFPVVWVLCSVRETFWGRLFLEVPVVGLSLIVEPVSLKRVQVWTCIFHIELVSDWMTVSTSFSLLSLAVHGRWSEWAKWSDCDLPCGGGIRQRNRTCSAPPPKNGGQDCEGMMVQSQSCNGEPCSKDVATQTGETTCWTFISDVCVWILTCLMHILYLGSGCMNDMVLVTEGDCQAGKVELCPPTCSHLSSSSNCSTECVLGKTKEVTEA